MKYLSMLPPSVRSELCSRRESTSDIDRVTAGTPIPVTNRRLRTVDIAGSKVNPEKKPQDIPGSPLGHISSTRRCISGNAVDFPLGATRFTNETEILSTLNARISKDVRSAPQAPNQLPLHPFVEGKLQSAPHIYTYATRSLVGGV